MDIYQWLGAVTMGLLVLALVLSFYVMTGKRSKKTVYWVSGTVLMLMLTVSLFCWVIYREYHA